MDFNRGALVSFLLAFSIFTLHEREYNESLTLLYSKYYPWIRRVSEPRLRARVENAMMYLSHGKLWHAFGLSRRNLNRLLILLLSNLPKADFQDRKASSGAFPAAVGPPITLRILAGFLYQDQMLS